MTAGPASFQQRLLQLKSNRLFEALVVSIIILSALLIGARTYQIDPTWNKILTVLDYSVTLFFLVEISIRFWAEENKRKECMWATALRAIPGARVPVVNFGASDCRCLAHLVQFRQRPDFANFSRALSDLGF